MVACLCARAGSLGVCALSLDVPGRIEHWERSPIEANPAQHSPEVIVGTVGDYHRDFALHDPGQRLAQSLESLRLFGNREWLCLLFALFHLDHTAERAYARCAVSGGVGNDCLDRQYPA